MNEFERACDEVDKEYTGESTQENVIEFIRNSKIATATLSQGKYITKVRKLAKEYPDEVRIIHENPDGSIVVHFPVSFIKLNNPPKRQLSEEQRAAATERLRELNKKRVSKAPDSL